MQKNPDKDSEFGFVAILCGSGGLESGGFILRIMCYCSFYGIRLTSVFVLFVIFNYFVKKWTVRPEYIVLRVLPLARRDYCSP